MALEYKDRLYLNLQEQVEKNKNDIFDILNVQQILNDYGIQVVGQVNNEIQLPDPLTFTGEYGEAFIVGPEPPYVFYIFTRPFGDADYPQWLNVGQLAITGPQGPQGIKGPEGPEGKSSKWITGNTLPAVSEGERAGDQYLNVTNGNVYQFTGSSWELKGSIRGPKGVEGQQGIQGPIGQTGPTGPRGPAGQNAFAVTIISELTSVNDLPMPTIETRHNAYIIGNRLYVIMEDQDNALIWQDVGFSDPGSRITVDGLYQGEYEMNQKVSVLNENNVVYTNNESGELEGIEYSAIRRGDTIAVRTPSGALSATDPINTFDLVTKNYLENHTVGKDTTTLSVYGTDSVGEATMLSYSNTPGNGNIPVYSTAGTLKSNTPTNDNDVATKAYADTKMPIPKLTNETRLQTVTATGEFNPVGIQYVPKAYAVPRWNENGCLQSNDPNPDLSKPKEVVTIGYLSTVLGNIETALDNIIALQNQYIGG